MTTPQLQLAPEIPQRVYLTQPDHIDKKKVAEAAVALAAAFLVYRRIVSHKLLSEQQPPLGKERQHIKSLWMRLAPVWVQLAAPAVQEAIQATTLGELSQEETEYIAASYAKDLGQYIHDTSADALVDGFHDQLAAKWGEVLSWHRVASAYGLDAQQMRAYVRAAINPTAANTTFQLLPDQAKVFIDKALLTRAERIGDHEAWQAMESGKAIAWLVQQRDGRISADAQKEWRTAEDERTCPVCRPLDRKRVALDEQWEATDGRKFWAPGVHPNCRCNIRLIYPEISDDIWSSTMPLQYPSKTDDVTLEPVGKAEDPETRRQASANQPRRAGRFAARPVQTKTETEPRMSTEQLIAEGLRQQPEEKPKVVDFSSTGTKDFSAKREVSFAAPLDFTAPAQDFTRKVSLATRAAAGKVRDFVRVKPVPVENRWVILYHDGKYLRVPAGEAPGHDDDAIRPPGYFFAHEYRRLKEGGDSTKIDFGLADVADRDIKIGNVLDMDSFPGEGAHLTTYPWHHDTGTLLEEAKDHYQDEPYFSTPAMQAAMNEYFRAWENWIEHLSDREDHIVRNMSDRDIVQTMHDSNIEWDTEQPIEYGDALYHMQQQIGFDNTNYSNDFLHAFTDMVERKYPHLVDFANSSEGETGEHTTVGDELVAARENLASTLLQQQAHVPRKMRVAAPHTPTVFIVPEYGPNTEFSGSGEALLHGKYQVYKVKVRNGNVEGYNRGDTGIRPDNIQSLRLVYLRPVEEDIDAEEVGDLANPLGDYWDSE